ncbi:MAG: replication initiator protein [Wigfec virus K19_159]|nr:MAG: replication initiator protein [Wigfec virus K19_159]
MTLEAMDTAHTAFVTLTYRDDALIYSIQAKAPTLIPNDLSLWLKRFRKATGETGMRFYAVGEYSPAERPHYHIILYGYKGCHYGKSRYRDGHTIDCCSQCDLVRDTWGKGIIETQQAAPEHFSYAAGYVMKKMTSPKDKRLNGRYPEFSRQSNRAGGIGINKVKELAIVAQKRLADGTAQDVPDHVRIDGKKALLGRYIRMKIRKELGGDGKAPPHIVEEMEAQMLPLLAKSRIDPENITLKKQLVSRASTAIASIKARHEMNNSRKRNRSL